MSRFQDMFAINLPFTRYNRRLQASAEIQRMIKGLIDEKRQQLENGASQNQDLITRLLSIVYENNQLPVVSENEIAQNVILVKVAGHDCSAISITFMVRLLANYPHIYAAVLQSMNNLFNICLFEASWDKLLNVYPNVQLSR